MWVSVLAWAEKYLIWLALIVMVVVIVTMWFFLHDHQVAVNAAAPAKAEAKVNAAQAQSGHDAINTVIGNEKKSNETDDKTRKSNAIILQLPGAAVTLDPKLDAAARRAVCMYDAAANLPECQRLLQPSTK